MGHGKDVFVAAIGIEEVIMRADDGYLAPEWECEQVEEIPQQHAVRVLVISAPKRVESRSPDPLTRKRQMIWRNRKRNRCLAAVAQAMVEGDLKALHGSGISLERSELPRGPRGRRVTVIVESTEHGRALQKLLPGWALLHDIPSVDDEETVAETTPVGRIATLVYVHRYGVIAHVLIRATGGRCPLHLAGFPLDLRVMRGTSLLIDLLDDGLHGRQDLDARLRSYLRPWWSVPRTDVLPWGS